MNILGITHIASWNPAACIVVDGEILAFCEEERFLRIKHAPGAFPYNAINYCLSIADLSINKIDVLSIGFGEDVSVEIFDKEYFESVKKKMSYHLAKLGVKKSIVRYYNHHLSHAASTFPCSGYASSNILSVDGSGEDCAGIIGFSEDLLGNYYSAVDVNVNAKNLNRLVPASRSWGELWSDVTELLGFYRHSGEGKTMGLAPYGEYDENVLPYYFDEFGCPDNAKYKRFFSHQGYGLKRVYQEKPDVSVDPLSITGKNLAHTLQSYYNEFLRKNAQDLYLDNDVKRFSVTGGCGLNCSGNGFLSKQSFVESLYTQPASHDAGTALGSAVLALLECGNSRVVTNFDHAYWGCEFSCSEIKNILEEEGVRFSEVDPSEAAACLLAENKIIGWFQGRAEIGPRALGNRSILADPRHQKNLDRVNKIKGRERWRPLSPSILEEEYFQVVDCEHISPFMLMAVPVNEKYKSKIPAVVHVDGSCRPQTVSKRTNPAFHKLILEFNKLTGVPVVLNTSFNLSYEPIVNSPLDAIRTFFGSGLDALVIGNFVVRKDGD